ncbi:hypothetical protein [Desulfuromonas sp. AOP6]|uniref:hypothetical protein n=1 Tax=Desulfuromonas sp. AOP6 TaxID=1566351 RepID=UPI00127E9D4B|nr:hypothetical protein [Desulfuromonas sp. AOP6]BCA79512.1 hypothetical protein AOP6_1299 [Desulfuromonas sp. AOP6]
MSTLLDRQVLDNGVVVAFSDRSNRYFGDYHRICIDVSCHIRLSVETFTAAGDPEAEYRKAQSALGEEAVYQRTLERMGVAGAEVVETRQRMINEFCQTNFPYLGSPEFPARFVASEMAKVRKPRHLFVPKP